MAVLIVCGIKEGKYVYEQIIQSGWDLDIFSGSSLMDMYATCVGALRMLGKIV